MPLIEVKLYDHRVTDEAVPKMIERQTEALADTICTGKTDSRGSVYGIVM